MQLRPFSAGILSHWFTKQAITNLQTRDSHKGVIHTALDLDPVICTEGEAESKEVLED